MKKQLFSKVIMSSLLTLVAFITQGQIISQYIETNSGTTPKGIEIWNSTGVTLNFTLNNLVIEKGTNGGIPSTDFTLNSGVLNEGEVIVIGTSDLETTTIANGSDFYLKAFTFNGDDAIVVRYGGKITDMFGESGVDPDAEWTGNGVSSKNQNIELKSGITAGDTNGWSDPSTRFQTVNSNPDGTSGDEGFGIAPVSGGIPNITVDTVTLSGFSYLTGVGPSTEQSFTVEGTDLSVDIEIAAQASYEISETSGSGYTNKITLNQSGGIVNATTIYVRLKAGLAAGDYIEDITASSIGANSKTVSCIGTVEDTLQLKAEFAADQTIVMPGTTIYFTDLTSGGTPPYFYSWDLDGDGLFNDSSDPNPSYTFYTAGTFDIGLKVTDSNTNPSIDQEIKTGYITVVNIATGIVINEIDVDTPGSDTAEFIELYDGGNGNTDLSGLVVVLYNGSDDKSYLPAIDLNGYSTDTNGYFVIGSTGMGTDIEIKTGWLQNGTDAVALYIGSAEDFPNDSPLSTDNLLDAIVYDTEDNDDTGLLIPLLNTGQPQINENGNGDQANHSNQRMPNGTGGQRNTNTFDQLPPTIGSENLPPNTKWVGSISDDWNVSDNWTNGIPDTTLMVIIPDVNDINNSPVIWNTGAECNELYIESGGKLYVGPAGTITTKGHVANNGTISLRSNESGQIASLIDKNGISGTGIFEMKRFIADGKPAYHLISTPDNSSVSGDFWGYYLYDWIELESSWQDVDNDEPWDEPLTPLKGYNIHPSESVDYNTEITFSGVFNSGEFSHVMSHSNYTGDVNTDNWNLLGNPYPSPINYQDMYDAGTYLATNQEPSIYCYSNMLSQYTSFNPASGIGTNGGTGIITPNQGFFVRTNSLGQASEMTFSIDNKVRTHDTATFYKSDPSNLVRLEASGNGYISETAIYFIDEAIKGIDDYDSRMLFASVKEVPALFSYANGNSLSLNSQPLTDFVTLGFKAGVKGNYTIEATNTSEYGYIVLEDIVTNAKTDLLNNVYQFVCNTEDIEDRFILHFNTIGINEIADEDISVYSAKNKIYINSTDGIKGDVFVYNLLGQKLLKTSLPDGSNPVLMENHTGYCIVKVITYNKIITRKVLIR